MTRPELEAGAVVELMLRYQRAHDHAREMDAQARQGLPVPLVHAILDESEARDALLALDPAQLRALAASLSQQQAEAEALRAQLEQVTWERDQASTRAREADAAAVQKHRDWEEACGDRNLTRQEVEAAEERISVQATILWILTEWNRDAHFDGGAVYGAKRALEALNTRAQVPVEAAVIYLRAQEAALRAWDDKTLLPEESSRLRWGAHEALEALLAALAPAPAAAPADAQGEV